MLTDAELLRKLDFFEPLDAKIIKSIASLCIVREFGAEEAIVRQGEAGLGLYFITGGKAKVEVERDGAKVIVAQLKAGDFLGEFSLLDEKTRSASVICLEETRCLLLTRDTFSKLLTKYPEIANQMLRTLVARIRNTNERIQTASAPTPPRPSEAPPALESAEPQSAGGMIQSAGGVIQSAGGGVVQALSAASEQVAAYVPKPEEVMQFYFSTKNQTQRYLNRFVGAIYAMKAMLRFSMAIVGCPVAVSAERTGSDCPPDGIPNGIPGRIPKRAADAIEDLIGADCNGVKLLLFPAFEDHTLRIEAVGDGIVSATIYRPVRHSSSTRVEVFRLQGPVRKNDVLRLHFRAGCPAEFEPSLASQTPALLSTGSLPRSRDGAPPHWLVSEARWR